MPSWNISIDSLAYVEKPKVEYIKKVKVSAYSPTVKQTDKTPGITASNLKLKKQKHDKKVIALSRNIAKKFEYGSRFELVLDNKIYNVEFQDLMNKKFKNKVDLLIYDEKLAKEFGVKEGILIKRN